MRLLLSVLPAAVCAAAMFLCFRMMRHSDMPADGHEGDDLDTLRKEVADLHEQLARARSVPTDAGAADGVRQIVRRWSGRWPNLGAAARSRRASAVETAASDPDTLYAGVLEGTEAVVWISRDGGSTWTMP